MGQKTNPRGFRLSVNRNWRSRWFANKQQFGDRLKEDREIRDFLMAKPCCSGTSSIEVNRMSDKLEVIIRTARPGVVIGKKGSEIDILRADLSKFTGKDVWIGVEEIKRPDADAKIVADGIARQLERRVAFKRAMKKAIQSAMEAGAVGIRVQVSGRLGGAEIARTEGYKEGRVPLQTLRDDIDFAYAESKTGYGIIGVKVWINLGERAAVQKRPDAPKEKRQKVGAQ